VCIAKRLLLYDGVSS